MIATLPGGQEASILVASVQVVVRRRTAEVPTVQMDLNATINSIPDPLVELSAAGEILAIHSAHRGPFHLPEQSEERRRLEDVLSPAAAATMRAALALAAAVAVADGRSPGQQIEVAKPGGVDWFELSIARRGPPNGDGHRYLMFCRDITERKRKEAGILRLNRLYATLSASNKMVASVRDASEMLRQICRLAVISGEM